MNISRMATDDMQYRLRCKIISYAAYVVNKYLECDIFDIIV
jgi:hypothetical protein